MGCRACLCRAVGLLSTATAATARAATRTKQTRARLSAPPTSFLQPLFIFPSSSEFSTAGSGAPQPPRKPPADELSDAESAVWDRLAAELSPTELVVRDISGGCGSMYGIEVASERFRGLSMLKQQRLVNEVLKDMIGGWHGVQIRTMVPE